MDTNFIITSIVLIDLPKSYQLYTDKRNASNTHFNTLSLIG